MKCMQIPRGRFAVRSPSFPEAFCALRSGRNNEYLTIFRTKYTHLNSTCWWNHECGSHPISLKPVTHVHPNFPKSGDRTHNWPPVSPPSQLVVPRLQGPRGWWTNHSNISISIKSMGPNHVKRALGPLISGKMQIVQSPPGRSLPIELPGLGWHHVTSSNPSGLLGLCRGLALVTMPYWRSTTLEDQLWKW